jgi:hypothetical protein
LHEQEYEVEDILKQRVRDGAVEYLVRWVGFPDQDTWEPTSAVENAPHKVRAYKRRLPPSATRATLGRRTRQRRVRQPVQEEEEEDDDDDDVDDDDNDDDDY